MSLDWQDLVLQFHTKFNVPRGRSPEMPSEDRINLRVKLIMEEAVEFAEAKNIDEAADALADLVYVALGAATEYGVWLDGVFREVHRANMRKVGGATRDDGKILKPDGWKPPNIRAVLARQGG